jgi:hypothetical protein
MARQLRGLPPAPLAEPPSESGPSVTIFPREWMRDPHSRWLHEYPSDLPWDDPALIKAMFAMLH